MPKDLKEKITRKLDCQLSVGCIIITVIYLYISDKLQDIAEKFWNKTIQKKERYILLSAGCLLIVVFYLCISHKMNLLGSTTNQIDFFTNIILPICTATTMFLLGITLVIITLDLTNKYIIGLILLSHIIAFFTFEYIKYIIGFSFLLIIVAFIFMILKEVIITMYSFLIVVIITYLFLIALMPLFPINTELFLYKYCYFIICIGLITYSFFAVRINKFLLKKFINDHDYSQKDFKNSFNIIYAFTFIFLNIFLDLLNGGKVSTLINNTLLTCIAINQINFSLIGDKFINMVRADFKKAAEKFRA